jgi:hypothetical protein
MSLRSAPWWGLLGGKNDRSEGEARRGGGSKYSRCTPARPPLPRHAPVVRRHEHDCVVAHAAAVDLAPQHADRRVHLRERAEIVRVVLVEAVELRHGRVRLVDGVQAEVRQPRLGVVHALVQELRELLHDEDGVVARDLVGGVAPVGQAGYGARVRGVGVVVVGAGVGPFARHAFGHDALVAFVREVAVARAAGREAGRRGAPAGGDGHAVSRRPRARAVVRRRHRPVVNLVAAAVRHRGRHLCLGREPRVEVAGRDRVGHGVERVHAGDLLVPEVTD